MKLKYIGTPGEVHPEINMYGITFPLNKVVTLDETDKRNRDALHKLPRHPHFEVMSDEGKALKVAASLGDPTKEAQRTADAKSATVIDGLTKKAEADKAQDAREIAAQEKYVAELAAKEEAAEKAAALAEHFKPKRR